MAFLHTLDLMARGGSIALLSLWSWILWRDQWVALSARVAVAMNVTIISYLLSYHVWSLAPFSPFALFVNWASVLAAPLFWLFAYVWFSDAKRISLRAWILLASFSGLALVQTVAIAITGHGNPLIWLAVRFGMVGFASAGLWAAWRERDNDLVEVRRRFRSKLIWIIGLFVIWISLMEIPGQGGIWTIGVRAMTELAMVIVAGNASAAMYRFGQSDMFAPLSPAKTVVPSSQIAVPDHNLAARLQEFMQTEYAWRDESLSITKLAAHLHAQEYLLRKAINGAMGHRNFAAFLNGYRLAEVKAALADAGQREVPIITIALDAGFGSLGPFNRAFREAEGMTPSEYRANHKA
jgi:AraC-like DNA-binding protein